MQFIANVKLCFFRKITPMEAEMQPREQAIRLVKWPLLTDLCEEYTSYQRNVFKLHFIFFHTRYNFLKCSVRFPSHAQYCIHSTNL